MNEEWEKEFAKLFDAHKLYENPNASISELKSFISSLLSLHDKKLAEKVRRMKKNNTNHDNENHWYEDYGFDDALDLAAQVIEGKELTR